MIDQISSKNDGEFKLNTDDIINQSVYKNEFKTLNQTLMMEDKNSLSEVFDHNFSNEIKFKDLRTNFYEVLLKYFKNFIQNNYKENLFVSVYYIHKLETIFNDFFHSKYCMFE